MLNIFNVSHPSKEEPDYAELIKSGAVVIDVRTPAEFNEGHIKGSINIPLDNISSETNEIKKKYKVVITCCRSGNRSGSAMSILKAAGVECYNGGPWNVLNNKI